MTMTDLGMARAARESRELMIQAARTLLAVIEEKDPHLRQHSERVANACAHFCEQSGLFPPKEIDLVYFAGLLHDLGLIFSPPEIEGASGELSEEHRAVLKQHPVLSVKLLADLSPLGGALPFIRHHHETWNGGGYPDGLKGEDIPLGARLIALFDRFDWMISPRFPQKGMEKTAALEEIINLSGQEFDSSLVDQFAQFIEATGGEIKEYIETPKKETANIKEVFTLILQKFASGKLLPPVMPQVVQELQAVVDQPNATADMMSTAIERDPVVALRLISIANSPAYRGMKEIRTVREAIPRMGLKETMNVVMAIANKSLYETKNPHFRQLMDRLWAHSIAAAFGAKLIGQHLKLADVELIFLMGLTHDIGKTLLLKAFSEEAATRNMDMNLVVANIQEAHLGISNLMLKRWGFNEAFIRAVSLHEKNEFDATAAKEALIVNLANMITRLIGCSIMEPARIEPVDLRSAGLLGISAEETERIGEDTKALVKDLAHLF